ncbi:MAG: glycosyltransferase family 4 protein [Calditrichaeota bacterium]|nr:glycosyltransferase family 4 protein [Calditrichota bacterium]
MKALIVAYYFPPAGGSGVQRTLKFVKYLPEFGWKPVVLTARNADYPSFDETLLRDVPKDVSVYRSKIVEPYALYRKLTGKKMGEALDVSLLTLGEQKRRLSERVSEWVRDTFFVPDARIGWLPFAAATGQKIIRKEGIDVLYTTAPPYTTLLIGLWLKRLTGLPWVVDFRDSWIGWLTAPQWRPGPSRRLEFRLEKAVLKEADRILVVSGGVKDDLLSRHPELDDDRWVWLPNGYDAADFVGVPVPPRDQRLTITYTGSLYGPRNPHFLLVALKELLAENPALREQLKFKFIGRIAASILEELQQPEFEGIFETQAYLTHRESVGHLLASDVSLLIIDDAPVNRGILTGKLFEYIGARRPILALAPEGDAAALIRRHKLGIVVHPKDVPGIKRELLHLLKKWQAGTLKPEAPEEAISRFDRRELTRELAQIFEDVYGPNEQETHKED